MHTEAHELGDEDVENDFKGIAYSLLKLSCIGTRRNSTDFWSPELDNDCYRMNFLFAIVTSPDLLSSILTLLPPNFDNLVRFF